MKRLLWIGTDPSSLQSSASPASGLLDVIRVPGSQAAIEQLGIAAVHAVVLVLPRPERELREVLEGVRAADPRLPVLLHDDIGDHAEKIMCGGPDLAYYALRSLEPEYMLGAVEAAHAAHRARRGPDRPEPWTKLLIGESEAMRQVREIVRLVASRRSTVLLTGESGTGKEVAARALHMASDRSAMPMVAVNCAAIPGNLLESELFGHTKGAFTGAAGSRMGRFEQAHRGTIFLDEIGEMPIDLQAKLLRVLQEREIQKLGSAESIPVDVRVIAASNIDFQEAIQQRRFREDLYYRLRVVPLRMPSMRERISDIPLLAEHLAAQICDREGLPAKRLSQDALEHLSQHSWPGNVRELSNTVETAIVLSGERRVLYADDFPLPDHELPASFPIDPLSEIPEGGIDFDEVMLRIQRSLLQRALEKAGGNKAKAAHMLGMKRTTLLSRVKVLEQCASQ